MEATTKFNIKDNVWLINKNKAERMLVSGVIISVTEPDKYEVKYDLGSLCEIPESRLFKTKEELLESL